MERDSLLIHNSLTHLSLMVTNRIEASQTITTPDRTSIPAFESVVNTIGCFSFCQFFDEQRLQIVHYEVGSEWRQDLVLLASAFLAHICFVFYITS